MNKVLYYFFFITTIYAFDPCLIVVGPPGSGKGNFSQYFMKKYGYVHISAGDLLRNEVEQKTEIGQLIEPIIKEGLPIHPDIMKKVLKAKIELISKSHKTNRMIIDGYGGQHSGDIEFLSSILEELKLHDKTLVIFFEAEDHLCIERMHSRLICRQCGYVHNSITMPAKNPGYCNQCSSELIRRPQDEPKIIEKRISHYRENMEPNYLKAKNFFPFIAINASKNIENSIKIFELLNKNIDESNSLFEFLGKTKQ